VLPRFTKGGQRPTVAQASSSSTRDWSHYRRASAPTSAGTHSLTRAGTRPTFDPEDLRGAPAHRVEELPNTAFAITAYADPFDFESTQAHDWIVEITRYLNARRKDRHA